MGGVGKESNVRIWFGTVAIKVYLLCEHAVELKVLFPFPLVTATWIGDYFINKRYAQNFGASIYSRVINMKTCLLRQWRCGSNSQRELWISFKLADFFLVQASFLFTLRTFGACRCVNKLTRCNYDGIVRSASPIIKESPINLAGESGNGNMFFNGKWHVQNKNGTLSPRSQTYA